MYENEVRSCIQLKKRNNIPEEVIDNYHKQYEIAKILDDGATENLDDNNDSVIHIDTKDGFIKEICFDPRTPEFQVDIYKEILGISSDIIKSTNIFSSK